MKMENILELEVAVDNRMSELKGKRISQAALNALADVQNDFSDVLNYGEYPVARRRVSDLKYSPVIEVVTISTRTYLVGKDMLSEVCLKISDGGVVLVETRLGKLYEHQTMSLRNADIDDVVLHLASLDAEFKKQGAFAIWNNLQAKFAH